MSGKQMNSTYIDQYKTISSRILELQKQLDLLQNNLSQSYDDENFTIGAAAKLKLEIQQQQLLLDKISKHLNFE